MTREELRKIAMCYAHDELKDSHGDIENVVAAAFIDGANFADAHPHWISVEDELPPLGCSMIVLISYGEDIQISEWDNGLFHETKLGAIIHPTYWMPLPQPPKEGGEE